MNKITSCLLGALLLTAQPMNQAQVQAQSLFISLSKGQSAQQQQTDTLDCAHWANSQTSFDPANATPNYSPPHHSASQPQPAAPPSTGNMRGGAAAGAAIGAIASDSSTATEVPWQAPLSVALNKAATIDTPAVNGQQQNSSNQRLNPLPSSVTISAPTAPASKGEATA